MRGAVSLVVLIRLMLLQAQTVSRMCSLVPILLITTISVTRLSVIFSTSGYDGRLPTLYPDLFSTLLVPKMPELTASPELFDGDQEKAKQHFEAGFRSAFTSLREKMDPRFPSLSTTLLDRKTRRVPERKMMASLEWT